MSSILLEACLLRPWPGNVRELVRELREAARSALDAGRMLVEAKDLSASAGRDMSGEPPPPAQGRGRGRSPARRATSRRRCERNRAT